MAYIGSGLTRFNTADDLTVTDDAEIGGNLTVTGSADINGGTIDGVTIGGASAGAGSFTTVTGSGDMNIDSGTLFVDASAGKVGIGMTNPDATLTVTADPDETAFKSISSVGGNLSVFTIEHDSDLVSLTAFNSGDALAFGSAGTERMRIDSSGNVGIGTSSPSKKLEIVGTANNPDSGVIQTTNANDTGGAVQTGLYVTNGLELGQFSMAGQAYNGYGAYVAGNTLVYSTQEVTIMADGSSDGNIKFASGGNTERMRISSNGNLLVGSTDEGGNITCRSKSGIWGLTIRDSASNSAFVRFSDSANNVVGSIERSGTSTNYVTSSDYRLKENVVDMTDAIDRVKQLNPTRFNFIADPDRTVDGFLAHEVQDIVPEAVTRTKDAMRTEKYEVTPALGEIYVPASEAVLDKEGNVVAEAQDEQIVSSDVERPETLEEGQQWRETTPAVMGEREVPDYQGIDQSKLVPLLTAALQDAIAKIETLESTQANLIARIEALEAN